MSPADEFVKRLAAVECDLRMNGTIGARAGYTTPDGKRHPPATDEELIEEHKARCVFCIARATLKGEGFPPTTNQVEPCKGCGSTAYGTHFGFCSAMHRPGT